MKYYIGTLLVSDKESNRDYFEQVCIAAKDRAQAMQLLDDRAANYTDIFQYKDSTGAYVYCDDNRTGFLGVLPSKLVEVSPVTFHEMRELLRMSPLGELAVGELAEEDLSEQTRTLARRLHTQLSKQDSSVLSYNRLLHAVAASLGETDWQVLLHKSATAARPGRKSGEWQANQGQQRYVPGTGFLWEVPLSVNATMSAVVRVRARDTSEAEMLARSFAAEGNVSFSVDEGSSHRWSDYYLSDDTEYGIRRVVDDEGQIPENLRNDFLSAQRGPYLVELSDVGGGEDSFLWADLHVYNPESPSHEVDGEWSALSGCPLDASPEEKHAFAARIAEFFARVVPNPGTKSHLAMQSAFYQAIQGEQTPDAFAAIEQKLRASE